MTANALSGRFGCQLWQRVGERVFVQPTARGGTVLAQAGRPGYPGLGLWCGAYRMRQASTWSATVWHSALASAGSMRTESEIPITIMVQDWGGPIGLGLACRRPELVGRLIIGNTFAWPLREPRVRVFSAVLGGPPGRVLTRWFNLAPRVFFARGFAQPVPAEVMQMYLAPWRDPRRRLPAAIAPRQLIAASGYLADLEAAMPKIADRPAMIVWGQKDFAFRQAARQRFEKLFPNHRTILLPHASHFLQEDAGEQIAAEFKRFRTRTG